jgi:galactokinase
MAERIVRVSVPGRLCLAGKHIDWMGGRVATLTVDLTTTVEARSNGDSRIEAQYTRNFSGEQWQPEFSQAGWLGSVVSTLHTYGIEPPGCQLMVSGDLPTSGGLASSAALCLALVSSLTTLAGISAGADQLAQLAYEAERHHGVLCGPMDQYAITHGGLSWLDCRHIPPAVSRSTWPSGLGIVVGASPTSCLLQSVLPGLLKRHAEHDSALQAYRRTCGELIEGMPGLPSAADLIYLISEANRLVEQFLGPFDPIVTAAMAAAMRSGALAVKSSGARFRGRSCFAICDDAQIDRVSRAMGSAGVDVAVVAVSDGIRIE